MESRSRRPLRPHSARGPERLRPPRRQVLAPEHAQRRSVAEPTPAARPRLLLRLTRHGIPALSVLAGVVAMCFGTETSLVGGAGLIGAGIASWLIAWLYRLGVAGDDARSREEHARAQFERTGRWPEA